MALGQEFDQTVLDMVRILILINQDVAPAPLVLFQDIGVLLEELHGGSQQIVEVEGPVGQELFLITGIHRRDGLGPEAIGLLPILSRINQFVLALMVWRSVGHSASIEIQPPKHPGLPLADGRGQMRKLLDSRACFRRRIRTQMEWKVRSKDPLHPHQSSTCRFSPVALLEEGNGQISQGAVPVANR